jgi:hypothetical protein
MTIENPSAAHVLNRGASMSDFTLFQCALCDSNPTPAVAIAPQDNGNGMFDAVPVCDSHLHGWWDGSDFPDGAGAPEAIMLKPRKCIPAQEMHDANN